VRPPIRHFNTETGEMEGGGKAPVSDAVQWLCTFAVAGLSLKYLSLHAKGSCEWIPSELVPLALLVVAFLLQLVLLAVMRVRRNTTNALPFAISLGIAVAAWLALSFIHPAERSCAGHALACPAPRSVAGTTARPLHAEQQPCPSAPT